MYFLDILGILIGFAGVMLFLSMIMTFLVQIVVNLSGMRWRVLRKGVLKLLASRLPDEESIETESFMLVDPDLAYKNYKTDKRRNKKDFLSSLIRAYGKILKPINKQLNGIRRIFLQPDTWLKPENFKRRLEKSNLSLDATTVEEVTSDFKDMKSGYSKRFVVFTRFVTFIISFFVAFTFQLNALDLFNELYNDSKVRAAYEHSAKVLLKDVEPLTTDTHDFTGVSDKALDVLASEYKDLSPILEEASGIGKDRRSILEELELVLEDQPVKIRSEIIERYAQILDDLHGEAVRKSAAGLSAMYAKRDMFNLELWPHRWGYYSHVKNWFGVLITMILLTFGAPFWYETLGKLVKLKDTLKQEKDKNGKKGEENEENS